jgi:hypothetical protein
VDCRARLGRVRSGELRGLRRSEVSHGVGSNMLHTYGELQPIAWAA